MFFDSFYHGFLIAVFRPWISKFISDLVSLISTIYFTIFILLSFLTSFYVPFGICFFFLYLFIYLFLKHLYWSIIALQGHVSFCFTTKSISYTYIPISLPSCISLPHSLSHPSRWSQSTELISLCYAAASHYLSILHLLLDICPCHYLTFSQLTLHPSCIIKSIL